MGRVTKGGGGASWGALALVVVTAAGTLAMPGGVGAEPTTGLLPSESCERYEQVRAIDERMSPPEVFDLDHDELADLLAERRELVELLAARTSGDLKHFLTDMLLWQESFDSALLDDWEPERRRLAREDWQNWSWREELVDDGEVRDTDGEVVVYDDVVYYHSYIDTRLAVECYGPELADGPRVDTSEDPPGGRILIHRANPSDDGYRGALATVSTTGDDERRLRGDGYVSVGHYDVSPTGDVALTATERDGWQLVVVGASGEVHRYVPTPGMVQPSCQAWDDRGERLLLSDNYAAHDQRHLYLVDLEAGGGAPTTERLDLPFAVTSCSDFLGDDRLVVSEAALDLDGERGVWTVGIDGRDPEELYAPAGCTTQVGSVDPTGTRVAVAQSCTDVLESGVVVVDLDDGTATRVATGFGALPRWSPDGEWLAFGFNPLGQRSTFTAWLARADGTQLRPLVEGPASFPNWLPE